MEETNQLVESNPRWLAVRNGSTFSVKTRHGTNVAVFDSAAKLSFIPKPTKPKETHT